MKRSKPSEKLLRIFYQVLPAHMFVEFRTMLGYPCCFINGNMFAAIHRDTMILRLPENLREDFLKRYKSRRYRPFAERTLKEYVAVPENLLGHPGELSEWVRKSFQFALSLPRKK